MAEVLAAGAPYPASFLSRRCARQKPEEYAREVIKRFMTRGFRRPVAKGEVDHYHRIYKIYDAEIDTLEQAMRETLAMVLISPQFSLSCGD